MTYLYNKPSKEKGETRVDVVARAIMYLGRANELARGVDVESLFLMSQMLMEMDITKKLKYILGQL